MQINSEILNRPKYQIQNVIKAYLKGDFAQANSQNDDYKAFGQHLLGNLNLKDKVFCNAYSTFIGKLLDAEWNEEHSSKNKVYHLGESHSLSYAHRNVTIAGLNYKIVPRITFGAKPFTYLNRNTMVSKQLQKLISHRYQEVQRFSYLTVKLTVDQTKALYPRQKNMINHWKRSSIRPPRVT